MCVDSFPKIRKFPGPRPRPTMFAMFSCLLANFYNSFFWFLAENKRIMRLFSGLSLSAPSSHKGHKKTTKTKNQNLFCFRRIISKRKPIRTIFYSQYSVIFYFLRWFLNICNIFIFRVLPWSCLELKISRLTEFNTFFRRGISIAIFLHFNRDRNAPIECFNRDRIWLRSLNVVDNPPLPLMDSSYNT